MADLYFTLLTDGSSDKALLPLLQWLLKQHLPNTIVEGNWADLRQLQETPKTLAGRIVRAVSLHPCHVLFIHRDAENAPHKFRKDEILHAFAEVEMYLEQKNASYGLPARICVIPVRMQEAWFLFNEDAIRWAAGNPNGRIKLHLPPMSNIENLPDPKSELYELLKTASGKQGRKLKNFRPSQHVQLIADRIEDFGPLRQLRAFQTLEAELQELFGEESNL